MCSKSVHSYSCFLHFFDDKVLTVLVNLNNLILHTGVLKILMKYLLNLQLAKSVIFETQGLKIRYSLLLSLLIFSIVTTFCVDTLNASNCLNETGCRTGTTPQPRATKLQQSKSKQRKEVKIKCQNK